MADLRKLQQKHADSGETYNFEGVPIFCAPGIHEKAFELFSDKKIGKDDPILILGAGAGGFEKRLLSHGFYNITAVEFVEGVHMVKEVKLLNNDLNEDFSYIGRFKAIIALEIIEHLENHFHFMRQIKNLFFDDFSFLILSTPNCENSFSRLKYFLVGRLQWFGSLELEGTGHITPIFSHILKFSIDNNGLKIERHTYNKSIWRSLFNYPNYIIRLLYIFSFLLSLFQKRRNDGEINIFLITNK